MMDQVESKTIYLPIQKLHTLKYFPNTAKNFLKFKPVESLCINCFKPQGLKGTAVTILQQSDYDAQLLSRYLILYSIGL